MRCKWATPQSGSGCHKGTLFNLHHPQPPKKKKKIGKWSLSCKMCNSLPLGESGREREKNLIYIQENKQPWESCTSHSDIKPNYITHCRNVAFLITGQKYSGVCGFLSCSMQHDYTLKTVVLTSEEFWSANFSFRINLFWLNWKVIL